jgi:hypothetical protein
MLKVLSRSVRWLALLGLAYVGILWVQPEPPFRDFKARADIEYDGRTITIEGPLRCTRSLPWVPFGLVGPPPHGGNSYDWSDVGIGRQLADGSAVVVALHPPCHTPSRIDAFSYPNGTYPVVYWLDKADRPDRVEAYFDRSGYEAAGARLKLKHVEMTYVGRSILPRLGATETVRAVPWTSRDLEVRRDRFNFVAYFAVVVREAQWAKRAAAAEILSRHATWRRFSEKDADRAAYQAVSGFFGSEFSLTCREFRDGYSRQLRNCDAIRGALTLDAQDGRFTLRKGASTTGIAVFVRREQQVRGQPRTTRFDLAGHEEQVVGFSRPVFFDPERRALISLREQLLSW